MMAQWLRALTALSRDLVQSQHSHDSSQVGPKMHGKTSVHIKKKNPNGGFSIKNRAESIKLSKNCLCPQAE